SRRAQARRVPRSQDQVKIAGTCDFRRGLRAPFLFRRAVLGSHRRDSRGPMIATLDEGNVGGYSVAYGRDDTYFPVYITAALAAIFVTAAWITGAAYWLLPALAAAIFTYYNIPLLETGRPTIGANQYGIFIQAFGLIRWRAIERIDLVE